MPGEYVRTCITNNILNSDNIGRLQWRYVLFIRHYCVHHFVEPFLLHVFSLQHLKKRVIYCFVTPSVFLTFIGCTYLKFVKNIIEQLNLLLSKSSVYTSLLCSSFCWTLCVTCFLFLTFLFIYCFVTPSVFLTLIGCTYLKIVK